MDSVSLLFVKVTVVVPAVETVAEIERVIESGDELVVWRVICVLVELVSVLDPTKEKVVEVDESAGVAGSSSE